MKLKEIIIILFFFFFSVNLLAQEKIYSFKSDIIILPSGDLDITETIKVRAEGYAIERGIYRAIPNTYKSKNGSKFKVDYKIVEILRDGVKENYHVKNQNGYSYIYLGNADIFLNPGDYTYIIHYNTNKQIGFYENFDELYWNVNGPEWQFEIDEIEATITLPTGAKIGNTTAYTGYYGESGKDFTYQKLSDQKVKFSTTKVFNPQENLSIGISWQKGIVKEPTQEELFWEFLKDNQIILLALFGSLIAFLLHLWNWKKVGIDPPVSTIIPLFKPMGNLSPSAMRYILKMKTDEKAFTAALVSMATKGFIKIEKKGSLFHLIKQEQEDTIALSESEKTIYTGLFVGNNIFKVSNAAYSKLSSVISQFESAEKKTHQDTYFKLNRGNLIMGLLASVLTLAAMFFLNNYSFTAGTIAAIIPIAFLAFGILKSLSTSKKNTLGLIVTVGLFLVFGLNIGSFSLSNFEVVIFGIAIIFLVFLNLLFAYLMKAPTLFGRKEMDKIEGFKMYLKTAEEGRLDSINAPDKTPELFEKYLPYAIALDCENQWANKFKDVIAEAMKTGTYNQPTWYIGNGARFSPTIFTNDIGNKLNNSINSASLPPSQRGSSGGGFSGGSGGGGFSGGGGGGGGGGGW